MEFIYYRAGKNSKSLNANPCEGFIRVVVNTVKGIQILPYNFGKYNLIGGFKKFRKVSCLFLTDIDSSMSVRDALEALENLKDSREI